MSAGNLHPLEVYVVCGPLEGLGAGVYHFAPLEFSLERLRSTDERAFLARACSDARLPAASLVITGMPWRTTWKYGERGWRHLYWDAGALLANLLAAADGVGLHARLVTGFVDRDIASLVGVDGVEEFPLAVVQFGIGEPISLTRDRSQLEPVAVAADPLSPDPLVLPLVLEAQRAGALESPLEVRRWCAAAKGGRERNACDAMGPSGISIDEAILRRGSTRLMRIAETPKRLLDVGIAAASTELVGDFGAVEGVILRHYVNVHSVGDTSPGTYVWTDRGLRLVTAGDQRSQSRDLCLDQPLAGDAAYTVFHTTELDTLLFTYGARGYRVANLCAGLASGRLALAAFALSFGASALTFRDDAVSACFGPRVSCLLVTAVGVPEYQNRRGGAPGEITELPHYEQLMERYMDRLGD
jgi:SagB-type dehydrogenase family enzyme